jgi:hypothetical protein
VNIVESASQGTDDTLVTSLAGAFNAKAILVNGAADLQGATGLGIEHIVVTTGQTTTFTGAQLTGNTISINESGSGTAAIIIEATAGGTTDYSNLTFTLTKGDATDGAFDGGADTITINGASTTAETITGTSIADAINGDSGNDVLSGLGGVDTIDGGTGQDTITSGAGADAILVKTGQATGTATAVAVGTNTITGFDVITDLTTGTTANAKDKIDFEVAGLVATAAAAGNFTDSTAIVGTTGTAKVITHVTSAVGLTTFAITGGGALTIASDSDLAAVVQYLMGGDIGDAGMAVVFSATYTTATRGSVTHSFIYQQTTNDAGATGGNQLVDLVGVTLIGLETTASTTDVYAFIA